MRKLSLSQFTREMEVTASSDHNPSITPNGSPLKRLRCILKAQRRYRPLVKSNLKTSFLDHSGRRLHTHRSATTISPAFFPARALPPPKCQRACPAESWL